MGEIDPIFYVPPIVFSSVSLAFLLLWHMKITPAWQWSAGFAQTAAGFVVSTFSPEPYSAAFVSGLIFIGAAYCYGSGLLVHFNAAPTLRIPRVLFAAVYSVVLAYIVFVEQNLIQQLFLTDISFALLLGVAVWMVTRRASRPIDIALVVTSWIVVLDCLARAIFFTFFTSSSDDFGDFATSLYNLEVSITTIIICMFFPFTALGASATAAIERHRAAAETDELTGLLNRRGFKRALERDFKSGGLSGSLIVCDIDCFKRINDTFGHAVGDRRRRSDLRTKRDSEDANLAAVARLSFKMRNHPLNAGSPVRQPLGIIGDARPRAVRRGDGVDVRWRQDMNEIGVQTSRADLLPDLTVNGRFKALAAAQDQNSRTNCARAISEAFDQNSTTAACRYDEALSRRLSVGPCCKKGDGEGRNDDIE
ncbi:GGDEF domain-containing protein [Ensifer aridi]|uniref:GGDEF domain-containing protein n=1 Tax=Ensifer aridi TaxID=1708715 RepID=UPI00358F845D